ncbi:hypothetical protein L0Y69_02740, partial [bacterium]|nr:hypothetical protein [bacterium]
MNKKTLWGVLIVVAILIVWYLYATSRATVIGSDLQVAGDYAVKPSEKIVFKDNAKLLVSGKLTLDGNISCESGALHITADGGVVVNGKVACDLPEEQLGENTVANSIMIVAKGPVEFGANAEIISNGHVQIVSDEKDLLMTQEQVDEAYKEAGDNSGTGPRIGPFVGTLSGTGLGALPSSRLYPPTVGVAPPQQTSHPARFSFIETAHAQVPRDDMGNAVDNVIISGTWHIGDGGALPGGIDIPTPPKKANKIILNFNLGPGRDVVLRDFSLYGPNGRDGKSSEGESCNARGERGEDAFRMRVKAANVTLDGFTLGLGNGGNGGIAETTTDCSPGIARGGDGGDAGNFKMTAEGKISIAAFHIIPGNAGAGGEAIAHGKDGKDGCPGEKGGDAFATGGDGGKNKKELASMGAVEGIENVAIDPLEGGIGGNAIASPGKGGNGNACKCGGGKGGDGRATGGKGGDASVSAPGGIGQANGGDGGNADAHGAVGGNGG